MAGPDGLPNPARGPGRPAQDAAGDDVHRRLLDAAKRLFAERGFGAVGLRAVAAAAGVTPAMVHYYFGGKQGLYEALLESVFDRLHAGLERLATAEPDDRSLVDAFLELYIETISRDPWILQLVVREVIARDSPLRHHFAERFASRAAPLLRRLIERERAAGHLRDDLDPRLTLLSLVGMSAFAFLAHPVLGPVLGYELDDAFRGRFTSHTARLFQHGARPETSP